MIRFPVIALQKEVCTDGNGVCRVQAATAANEQCILSQHWSCSSPHQVSRSQHLQQVHPGQPITEASSTGRLVHWAAPYSSADRWIYSISAAAATQAEGRWRQSHVRFERPRGCAARPS